ncbi:hypothetical protein TNCV_795421 [Trichonephila clavipes]|nr:hypothetical protein TNCV_795421 [Trichonephila clavipes]
MFSNPGLQQATVSCTKCGTYLTGLRAYRPIFHNRLYTVCRDRSSFVSNCQIPVLIRCCNSRVTSAVTSTHITIILESLSKPADDSLSDSTFLGYFQLAILCQKFLFRKKCLAHSIEKLKKSIIRNSVEKKFLVPPIKNLKEIVHPVESI